MSFPGPYNQPVTRKITVVNNDHRPVAIKVKVTNAEVKLIFSSQNFAHG